ncbi:hypothetical protein L210DRAFT_2492743 [Boletus edulis BED1]|uniref:Uncharacterized protein n=1 Tax=Boletus edulis BED1 TaxID=1328754 RepID=A0AAD4BPP9_BOLED|nr:hypothetical protein L210DRAFT_2492743 [Boletus edulis BED1]
MQLRGARTTTSLRQLPFILIIQPCSLKVTGQTHLEHAGSTGRAPHSNLLVTAHTRCSMSISMGWGRSCRMINILNDSSTSCQYSPSVIVDDPQNVA